LDPLNKEIVEASLEENRRTEKRFSRGLEDISHLFLSQSTGKPVEKAAVSDATPALAPSEKVQATTPFLLHDSPSVIREDLLGFLNGTAAVLEEGLRTIDANVPCDPFGFIDLVALDSQNQLCIINVDVLQKDESLLRGIACFDWVVRNTPIVRRMYHGRVINFSAQPRLFLVAPGFSPLLKCVAQRSASPLVCCCCYRPVVMPGGVGLLFSRA
jgi:hypothetical protein